jgi:hypothetical protein
MPKTEWIVSIDDDLTDFDELFVGNVRDGDMLIRCKDCLFKGFEAHTSGDIVITTHRCSKTDEIVDEWDYCSRAERKEHGTD